MNFYNLTKSIERISEESYFYGHLEDFWYSYTLIPGNEKEIWEGQNSYEIEYPSVRKPGFLEKQKRILSEIILNDIQDRFEKLSFGLANYIEPSNFHQAVLNIKLITSRLDDIKNKLLSLSIPEPYKKVIATQFDESYDIFKKDYSDYINVKKKRSEPGIEFIKIDDQKWGWNAFNEFSKMLIESKLVPSNTTKKQLEKVFRKKKLKEKITWEGDHPEAHYFFTALKKSKYIKINPIWQSVVENFIILDEDNQPMKSDQLRSLETFDKKKPSDLTRMKEINSIVDILNSESS